MHDNHVIRYVLISNQDHWHGIPAGLWRTVREFWFRCLGHCLGLLYFFCLGLFLDCFLGTACFWWHLRFFSTFWRGSTPTCLGLNIRLLATPFSTPLPLPTAPATPFPFPTAPATSAATCGFLLTTFFILIFTINILNSLLFPTISVLKFSFFDSASHHPLRLACGNRCWVVPDFINGFTWNLHASKKCWYPYSPAEHQNSSFPCQAPGTSPQLDVPVRHLDLPGWQSMASGPATANAVGHRCFSQKDVWCILRTQFKFDPNIRARHCSSIYLGSRQLCDPQLQPSHQTGQRRHQSLRPMQLRWIVYGLLHNIFKICETTQ